MINKGNIDIVSIDDLPQPMGPAPTKEMVESVKAHGVIQPILIGVSGGQDRGDMIVDGNRRAMAARKAGVSHVPVIRLDGVDEDVQVMLILQMNNLRSQNEYAEQMAFMHLGSDAAKYSGLSRATISKRDRWAGMPTTILNGFFDGRVAPSVMDQISRAKPEVIDDLAKQIGDRGKITGPDVKETSDRYPDPEPEVIQMEIPPRQIYDGYVMALQRVFKDMIDIASAAGITGSDVASVLENMAADARKIMASSPDDPAPLDQIDLDEVPF